MEFKKQHNFHEFVPVFFYLILHTADEVSSMHTQRYFDDIKRK